MTILRVRRARSRPGLLGGECQRGFINWRGCWGKPHCVQRGAGGRPNASPPGSCAGSVGSHFLFMKPRGGGGFGRGPTQPGSRRADYGGEKRRSPEFLKDCFRPGEQPHSRGSMPTMRKKGKTLKKGGKGKDDLDRGDIRSKHRTGTDREAVGVIQAVRPGRTLT